jgi:hypothetical protein
MHFHEEPDEEVAEYRTVSKAAAGSLILGLLAPAAFVDPVAWCIPLTGIVSGGVAMFQIRRNAAALAGRKAALWGLWLSLFFATAAAADHLYYRYRLRREAEQFAAMWFELLAEGRPERAFQLAVDRINRQPLDDRLPDYYRNNYQARAQIDRYVAPAGPGEKPRPVRTLLALGKRAKVRCLDAPFQACQAGVEVVHLRYAVTFDDDGETKTFLLLVQLHRRKGEDGRSFWKISGCSSADEKPEDL